MNTHASQALKLFPENNKNLQHLDVTAWNHCPMDSQALETLLLGVESNQGLKTLVLRCALLNESNTPGCATAWTSMLENNASLQVLELKSHTSGIPPQRPSGRLAGRESSATAIALGLSRNKALQKLVFKGVLSVGGIHGPSLRDALATNSTLTELVLRYCQFDVGTFQLFCDGLSTNRSLKKLNIIGSYIGNAGAAALARAILNSNVLESLNLSWDCIEGPDGAAAIRDLFLCTSLKTLRLYGNRIGPDDDQNAGTVFPLDLAPNNSLVTLDLSYCGINARDLHPILSSFIGSSSLEEIGLNDNGVVLDLACATALRRLLETAHRLRMMNLSDNESVPAAESMAQVAAGLRVNTTLKELHICSMDDNGLVILGEVFDAREETLNTNSTLESLQFGWDSIWGEDFSIEALRSVFALLPGIQSLKELTMGPQPNIDASVVEVIIEGLSTNTSLESLRFYSDHEARGSGLSPAIAEMLDAPKKFYLAMNRNGRKFWNVAGSVPLGAWSRLLAKMSSEHAQIFYFLRNKPSLWPEID